MVKHELVEPEWQAQPGERREDFEAFRLYRDMMPKRTLLGVVRALGTSDNLIKKEFNRIGNIAARWQWSERVRRYEMYLDQDILEKEKKARKEMRQRLADHAKGGETALMTVIKQFLGRFNSGQMNFDNIPDDKLFFMVVKAVEKLATIGEFERKVRGEPDYIKQDINQNTTLDVTQLSDEELEAKLKKQITELGFKVQ